MNIDEIEKAEAYKEGRNAGLKEAKDAFIEAFGEWHNAEGAARLDTALAMDWAWKHLQQLEAAKMEIMGGEQS
jgi:hypothetical protein